MLSFLFFFFNIKSEHCIWLRCVCTAVNRANRRPTGFDLLKRFDFFIEPGVVTPLLFYFSSIEVYDEDVNAKKVENRDGVTTPFMLFVLYHRR